MHAQRGVALLRRLFLHAFSNVSPLRAGMPQAVISEVGTRGRIVGPVALGAVGGIAAALRHYRDCRVGIVAVIAIIVGIVVIPSAVIGVRAQSADRRTCREAGPEAAAMTPTAPVPAAAVPIVASCCEAASAAE